VSYDEGEIHDALQRLARRGWTRLASGAGSRAAKYRQLFVEELGVAEDEVAVLCVLMLRGPQTPGELKSRTERLHRFDGLSDLHDALERLAARELVRRLARQPGQKEERYRHLLGADGDAEPSSPRSDAGAGNIEARVQALEDELRRLRAEVEALGARGNS
jgi:uncharacterized protein YceH (UPF0502 family)